MAEPGTQCGVFYPYSDYGAEVDIPCELPQGHEGPHHFELDWECGDYCHCQRCDPTR